MLRQSNNEFHSTPSTVTSPNSITATPATAMPAIFAPAHPLGHLAPELQLLWWQRNMYHLISMSQQQPVALPLAPVLPPSAHLTASTSTPAAPPANKFPNTKIKKTTKRRNVEIEPSRPPENSIEKTIPSLPVANYALRTYSSNPKATTDQLRAEIDGMAEQLITLREHYSGVEAYYKKLLENNYHQYSISTAALNEKIQKLENLLLEQHSFLNTNEQPEVMKTEPNLTEDKLKQLLTENANLKDRLNSLEEEKRQSLTGLHSFGSASSTASSSPITSSSADSAQPFQAYHHALLQSPFTLFNRHLASHSPLVSTPVGLTGRSLQAGFPPASQSFSPELRGLGTAHPDSSNLSLFSNLFSPPFIGRNLALNQPASIVKTEEKKSPRPGLGSCD